MVTETFCTPIDPWRAHAIGMYPFVACVALVLRIFAVCHDNLHSQKNFPLGSVMRQWPDHAVSASFLVYCQFCHHNMS